MAHVDTHRNIDDYFYPASYPIGKVAMYEGTGVEMSSWVILGIVIIGCLVLIAVISLIEKKYNKRLISPRQEMILENAKERAQEVFCQVRRGRKVLQDQNQITHNNNEKSKDNRLENNIR